MVRVKLYICLCLLFSLCYSCKNSYRNTEGSIRPKKVNFKIKKELSNEENLLDTESVYELYASWSGDYNFNSARKDNYKTTEEYRHYDGTLVNIKAFIRFYANGNLSYFYEEKTSTNEDTFNPEKGGIGVYLIKDDEILIEMFFASYNIGGQYIKSKARINEDTLHLIKKRTGYYTGTHKVYIRKEIPKEYLDWEADW